MNENYAFILAGVGPNLHPKEKAFQGQVVCKFVDNRVSLLMIPMSALEVTSSEHVLILRSFASVWNLARELRLVIYNARIRAGKYGSQAPHTGS